jgi:hypothetical protein
MFAEIGNLLVAICDRNLDAALNNWGGGRPGIHLWVSGGTCSMALSRNRGSQTDHVHREKMVPDDDKP